ncbi:MAG: DoxX family protein [Thermoplasmata archaeon]|nr:DoxX family protein [Thermoplasmata archaeon]
MITNEGNWWVKNIGMLKTTFRVLLGVIWILDGVLKFTSGFVDGFPGAVQNASNNAPGWLSGWYAFWQGQANGHAMLIVYTVGVLELVLGIALVAGFMRKIAYVGGVFLSLLIWAVPEGFGGPYGGGAGGTDVGTGVIYALVFLGLIVINSAFGPSRASVDALIERRFPRWAALAEFVPPPTVASPAARAGATDPRPRDASGGVPPP